MTTSLKIKPGLVVKNTHTELLLLSENLETTAMVNGTMGKALIYTLLINIDTTTGITVNEENILPPGRKMEMIFLKSLPL